MSTLHVLQEIDTSEPPREDRSELKLEFQAKGIAQSLSHLCSISLNFTSSLERMAWSLPLFVMIFSFFKEIIK